MAIKNTELGGTDWNDGEVLEADDLNDTFTAAVVIIPVITEVYKGSDFDSSQTALGTDENSHEMTAITSTQLTGKSYVKIETTVESYADSTTSSGRTCYSRLKAQIKETGGSYADIEDYIIVSYSRYSPTRNYGTVTFIADVTSGMLTNGLQIKMFTDATASGDNVSASNTISNKNTIITVY